MLVYIYVSLCCATLCDSERACQKLPSFYGANHQSNCQYLVVHSLKCLPCLSLFMRLYAYSVVSLYYAYVSLFCFRLSFHLWFRHARSLVHSLTHSCFALLSEQRTLFMLCLFVVCIRSFVEWLLTVCCVCFFCFLCSSLSKAFFFSLCGLTSTCSFSHAVA